MSVVQIYDQGQVFAPSVLDIEEKTLLDQFLSGIKTIAAISLALNYPTLASVAHSLVNSYKNVLAISLATDYTYEGSEKVRCIRSQGSVTLISCFYRPKHTWRIPQPLLLLLPPLPRLHRQLRLLRRRSRKRRRRSRAFSIDFALKLSR